MFLFSSFQDGLKMTVPTGAAFTVFDIYYTSFGLTFLLCFSLLTGWLEDDGSDWSSFHRF